MQIIDQSRLFIIIGAPRSGTSLLQEIMNCFDGFCNVAESRIDGPHGKSCYGDVRERKDFRALDNFIAARWNNRYFVEKQPESILCLPELQEHFPNANYIFIERDPRPVYLSLMNMHLRMRDQDEFLRNHRIVGGGEAFPDATEIGRVIAKELLNTISLQVKYKPLFKNQFTIRYRELTHSLMKLLLKLERRFGIKCDYERAMECLTRPSYSSTENLHTINKIEGSEVKAMLDQACKLWHFT